MLELYKSLDITLFKYNGVAFEIHDILGIVFLFFIAKVVLKVTKRIIDKRLTNVIDRGRSKAMYQLFSYIVFVVFLLIALEFIGVKITILLAGSAALLVGLGLGIQSLFNDFVSGILLLFEGTISVGDIIEVDGLVGQVKNIYLRTSEIETQSRIIIIVPNHKLVSENVINWSHNRDITRFEVCVGVAYGSDLTLVKKLLEEVAFEHEKVSKVPEPTARFINFGDSALDFELLFYTKNMFIIEFIKSDLRFAIDKKFRENNITIPFPQRDVHMYKTDSK